MSFRLPGEGRKRCCSNNVAGMMFITNSADLTQLFPSGKINFFNGEWGAKW